MNNFGFIFQVLVILLKKLGVKKIQCFRPIVKVWNKQEVGKLETNIEQIEKEI